MMTRDCRWTLFPVCARPSSLQMRLRSLLMRVRERSIMDTAICCRLEAMVVAGDEAGRRSAGAGETAEAAKSARHWGRSGGRR